MYKTILTSVALAAGLLLLQCSDKPTQPEQAKLGEPFVLKWGQTIAIQNEDLFVMFRDVVSDSRCPTNALCFWPGIAEVQIRLATKSADTAVVTVGILGGSEGNSDCRCAADTLGYHIALLKLDPYPDLSISSGSPRMPEAYRATLGITRSGVVSVPVPEVIITDLPPESIQIAHFGIDSMSIAGDTLDLAVSYGGGCQNHYFFLFMSPATFAESVPVQANLWLRHFDNADSCKCDGGKCYNHRTLRFDLRPIAELCNQIYGESRRVVINAFQFVGQYPEQKRSAIYEPTGWINHAPVISLCCGSGIDSVKEGGKVFIWVAAADSDGTTPVVNAKNLPQNARFWKVQDRYAFQFEPNYKQSGIYHILFTASDGSAIDSATAPIIVVDAGNQVPRWINGVWPSEVTEGKILRCYLDAYDPDAKKLYLTADNLPDNSTFVDSGNGRAGFVFFPGASDTGIHVITFTVTDDSGATASMDNSVTVKKWINQKPRIDVSRRHQFVAEGDTLGIRIGTYDPDGGVPFLTVSNLPSNATFTYANRGAGRVDFYPAAGQAGQYDILCIACDAWDSTLCDTLNLSVTVQVVTNNQGPLIPLALGNYWVYGNAKYESSLVDSTEVVSVSETEGETWCNLSPAVLFGQRLRSSGDSVFNENGLQLIVASDTTVLFPVEPGFLPYSGTAGRCQVTRLTRNVTVPAGTFANCYQYSRNCSYCDGRNCWGSIVKLIVAPGVGVIYADWFYDTGPYIHRWDMGAFQLERYQLR